MSRTAGLSSDAAEIIRFVGRHRYVTVDQVNRRFSHSPNSSWAGVVLPELVEQGYLFRFGHSPRGGGGSHAFVYSLDEAGRRFLRREGFIPAFANNKAVAIRNPPQSLDHSLLMTDVLIGAELLAALNPKVTLLRMLGEYELLRMQLRVSLPDIGEKGLAPDAFVELQMEWPDGTWTYPIFLEVDRGNESQGQWQVKVRQLLAFAAGDYVRLFQATNPDPTLNILVIAPGNKRRAATLEQWTRTILTRFAHPDDYGLFSFSSLRATENVFSPLLHELHAQATG